jgi:two-component system, chemotaxis family, protein-glutamate methylesterase/glutaminase
MSRPIRVLIVDDSALARRIIADGLAEDPGIEVAGTANDPYQARDRIVQLRPDVMTLDLEMPRMDGVEFLRRLLPQWPLPVVMVSSLTEKGGRLALDALQAGAVEVVTKPSVDIADGLRGMLRSLRQAVRVAASAKVNRPMVTPAGSRVRNAVLPGSTDKLVAIGASTGGTEAIASIISRLPPNFPGVVIVQHMPAGFTRLFAERLDRISAVRVTEARAGDRIMIGHVLVAPGDQHVEVRRSGGQYRAQLHHGDLCSGHRPSVDVLFDSVATHAGSNAIGVLLTGMGRDGAAGMLSMRRAGARCLAQNEASCVVYGMPKEAMANGAAERAIALRDIPAELLRLVGEVVRC